MLPVVISGHMPDGFLEDLHKAFTKISAEVDEEGGEFDFRYSLVEHLFINALGWTRNEGEGHVRVGVRGDRNDVLIYDDSDPPIPVIDCETKPPSDSLSLSDKEQLETYIKALGSADYGALTNGKEFILYQYDRNNRVIKKVDGFDVGTVAAADSVDELDDEYLDKLDNLSVLRRDRYVNIDEDEFFIQHYQEIPVEYRPEAEDIGYELFLDSVTTSLEELSQVMQKFFDDYRGRDTYAGDFLNSAFSDWVEWREYTDVDGGNERDAFCRETAYIILNRTLFGRIAEDKEIVGNTNLSWQGMAQVIRDEDKELPYLSALKDSYRQIEDYYSHLYELNVFDWWWISRDHRQRFSKEERQRQQELEKELNYKLKTILKRLNRFDFEFVDRDILGNIYEDYLPKEERKRLGEFYTPIEVVQYMLDTIGFRETEDIGQKTVLDPACGSGTFLTEVTDRLVNHYMGKFGVTNVNHLDTEQAQIILDRIQENVYGIDINPFATHISEINLLFQTIDLYDIANEDPHYSIEGFEVHCADTLTPTQREWQKSDRENDGMERQAKLGEYEKFNGRAEAFIEDLEEVERLKNEQEFDLVVANPPYVTSDEIGDMRDTYYSSFPSAIKDRNFDLYVPFIQRGLKWLSDDGQLAYIIPNRLLNADYAERVRKSLVEEPITHLIDFKETDVFDISTPYPCIVNVDKSKQVNENHIRCARFISESIDSLDQVYHLDEWQTPDDVDDYKLFKVPQSQIYSDSYDEHLPSWKVMPSQEREVFDKIESKSDKRISDIRDEVFEGLITGKDKVFIGEVVKEIDKDNLGFETEGDEEYVLFEPTGSDKDDIDDEAIIEKSILRRILKGKDIERWSIDWKGLWAIFPYRIEDEEAKLFRQEEFNPKYKKAWEYLEQHKDKLDSRTGTNEWWAFTRPRPSTMYRPNKLMMRVMAQEPSFVPDPEAKYCFVGGGTAGGYGVLVEEKYIKSKEDLTVFGALFNSLILEFYIKNTSFIFGDKHYSHNQQFLDPVPIGIPEGDLRADILDAATNIVSTNDELTDLRYKTSDIQNYTIDYDSTSSILDLVNELDLSDEDYRQDPIRKNDSTQDGDEVYEVVMKQSHTLEFESKPLRDFAYMYIKSQGKRMNRSEVVNLSTPPKGDVIEIMNEYQSDKEMLKQKWGEMENLQGELNQKIAKDVYGLNEDDISVINDYLSNW